MDSINILRPTKYRKHQPIHADCNPINNIHNCVNSYDGKAPIPGELSGDYESNVLQAKEILDLIAQFTVAEERARFISLETACTDFIAARPSQYPIDHVIHPRCVMYAAEWVLWRTSLVQGYPKEFKEAGSEIERKLERVRTAFAHYYGRLEKEVERVDPRK